MNTDVAAPSVSPSPALPHAVVSFLNSLRRKGIIVQYAEMRLETWAEIGLSNFPAKFPFQLGKLAAKLECSLPDRCSITEIQFGSEHPTLGRKCTVSLSLHCLPIMGDTHE